jgi:hypothetical protein
MPRGNSVSDIRCGNIEMSSNRVIRMIGFHSAPSEDDELHYFGEFSKAVPRRQAADVIFSDEIEQLHVGLALAECLDCVDGIRGRRTAEFHRIEDKTRFVSDRTTQHFQTDIGCRQLLIQFVGRSGSRNKDHGFKIKRFEGFARQNQVTVVDRIEGTTEDADLFQAKHLFGNARAALCPMWLEEARPRQNGTARIWSGHSYDNRYAFVDIAEKIQLAQACRQTKLLRLRRCAD